MGIWLRRLRSGLLRLLGSALLLSLNLALLQALVCLPVNSQRQPLWYGVGGFAAGLVVFALLLRAQRAYVFGHEFTHWLVAKLFGRPTGAFRAGAEDGSVSVARPNIWIVLGPYLVPIYALVWVAVYLGLGVVWPQLTPPGLFYGGLGLTYAFHCVRTVAALRAGQSDLRHYGPVFSLLLILAVNLAIIGGALTALSGDPAAALRTLSDAWRPQFRLLAWLFSRGGS